MGSLVILNLTDVDSDGLQEWLVLDARFEFAFNLCHACSPAGFRLYAWDGEACRNASAQFPDYYQEQIDDLTAQVEGMAQNDEPWTGCELGPMISLLLAYENAGRSEEGLAVFEQYSDPALYTSFRPLPVTSTTIRPVGSTHPWRCILNSPVSGAVPAGSPKTPVISPATA